MEIPANIQCIICYHIPACIHFTCMYRDGTLVRLEGDDTVRETDVCFEVLSLTEPYFN